MTSSVNRLQDALKALPRSSTPDAIVEREGAHIAPAAPPTLVPAVRSLPEAELCDQVGEWLRQQGAEVYFEVPVRSFQPDILAFLDGQTVAIETKLDDWRGVLKQGARNASFFDRSWVAMPFRVANRAAAMLADAVSARQEQGLSVRLPGVLGVSGERIVILAEPQGAPSRRLSEEKLRRAAGNYGKERGGVPSQNQLVRNVAIWNDRKHGASYAKLAAEYRLSASGVRDTLKRMINQRDHLAHCDGNPCHARGRWLAFYAMAHRERDTFVGLGHL